MLAVLWLAIGTTDSGWLSSSSKTTAANGYVTKTDMDMGLLEYKTTTQVHADAYMPPKQRLMTVTPPDARSVIQAQAQAQAV